MGHHVVKTVGISELASTLDGMNHCRLISLLSADPVVDKTERRVDVVYFDMTDDFERIQKQAAEQATENAGLTPDDRQMTFDFKEESN